MVEIVLKRFGRISKERERDVLTIINECYQRLKPHEVMLLDLLLFNSQTEMKTYFSHERTVIGVVSDDFSGNFFAMHDAWRGTSRISICMDRINKIPRLAQVGTLRHEVGHSVLHGSLEHYVFPITASLIKASKKYGLSEDYLLNLTYLISIAVKDFEVTRLLLKRGYFKDQVAHSQYILSTSGEDLDAWEYSKGNPAAKALCLAGRLKDAACYIALQPKLGKAQINNAISNELSYLPDQIRYLMLDLIKRFQTSMEKNTFQNVDSVMRIFIQNIIAPLYEERLLKSSN